MTHHGGQRPFLPMLLITSIGCALSLVDTNVIAIAVPAITQHFEAEAAPSQWIISAYFLSFAAALLPAGAIADRHGRRRAFLFGVVGLAVASLFCVFATTILWLNLFRGMQGVMTAFVVAPALALIGHRFHGQAERNRAWAIWGGIMGITMVITPVAGGVLVQKLGWQWAFLVNIPICIALAGGAIAYVEDSRDPTRGRLDPAGIILFATSMFGVSWGLISGQAQGWISASALAGFATGALGMAAFIIAERVQTQPMIDLALFRSPSFIGAVWTMFAYAGSAQVMASLFPIFFQNGIGLSTTTTGLAMLPFGVAMLIFPYLGARLGRRLPLHAILAIGFSTVAIGNIIAGYGVFTGQGHILFPGMFVIGSGAGLLNGETQKAIMMTIPRDQTGIASGISTTARFTGMLMGFAALNAVIATVQPSAASVQRLESDVTGFAAALLAAALIATLSAVIAGTLVRPGVSARIQILPRTSPR